MVQAVLVALNFLLHRLGRKTRLVHLVQLVQMGQKGLAIQCLQMGRQVLLHLYLQHFQ